MTPMVVNLLSLLASLAILFSFSYIIIEIIDYAMGISALPNLNVSLDGESAFINSPEGFYFELFRFIFEYEGQNIVHIRDDLSSITKGTEVFEKFVRTSDCDVIRNYTIESNSTNNSKILLKAASYIVVQDMTLLIQSFVIGEEIKRLKSLNLTVISKNVIFDKNVVELVGISKNISKNINQIINKINNL